MSKKKRKHRPLSGSLKELLTRTDSRRKDIVQQRTGIYGNENAYDALKRFVAQGEDHWQEIVDVLEKEPVEDRDKILRRMIIQETLK